MLTHPSTLPRHREPQIIELTSGRFTALHSHRVAASVSSGEWVIPGWIRTTRTTTLFTINFIWYQPIFVMTTTAFDRIGVEESATGSAGSVRLGIYEADVSDPTAVVPKALVLDAGTVAVGTIGVKQITISETLNPGFYFLTLATGVGVTLYSSLDASGPMEAESAATPGDEMDRVIPTVFKTFAALADPATAPTAVASIVAQSTALRR